jgi:KaiC/GvpD/RAD55 family RecA-like ATPase
LSYKIGVPRIDRSLGGVAEGTNLLVTGDAVSGMEEFVGEAVSEGTENGEGTVYVTTDDTAEELLKRHGGNDPDRFGVVDCVTESQGDEEQNGTVKFASSPSDMTGIGVKVSSFLKEFHEERGIQDNRVFVDSVSTLLTHSSLETVFRFLHVFTGRIRSVDGFGVFFYDPVAHGEREYSTLRQLFDGVVEVERGDDEDVRLRVVGLRDEPTEWVGLG